MSPNSGPVGAADTAAAGESPGAAPAAGSIDAGASADVPTAGGPTARDAPGALEVAQPAQADAQDPAPLANFLAFVPVEGARLKRIWFGASATTPYTQGIPEELETWYDSELHTPCTFTAMPDGEWRCLPDPPGGTEFYVDAACTTPAVSFIGMGCAPPDVVRFSAPADSPCSPKYRYLRRGPKFEGTVYGRSGSAGECSPSNGLGLGSIVGAPSTYRLDQEVLPARFVKGVKVVRPGGGGVNMVLIQGEDGSLGYGGLEHGTSHSLCNLYGAADGMYHCIPQATTTVSDTSWADATCTAPAVSVEKGCAIPGLALSPRGGACPQVMEARLVVTMARSVFSLDADNRCTARANSTTDPLFTTSPPLPDTGFPGVPFLPEAPAGQRLRRRRVALASGEGVVWNDLWDDVTKLPCVPRKFPSGKYRCSPGVPGGIVDLPVYSDAQCTKLVLHQIGQGTCVPRYVEMNDLTVCPRQVTLYAVGALYTGPVFFRVLGCLPFLPTKNDAFHAITPVAEDQFPELTIHQPP